MSLLILDENLKFSKIFFILNRLEWSKNHLTQLSLKEYINIEYVRYCMNAGKKNKINRSSRFSLSPNLWKELF